MPITVSIIILVIITLDVFACILLVLVGFAEAHINVKLTEKLTNHQNICVILYKPDEEIDPLINIILTIEVIPNNEISKLI